MPKKALKIAVPREKAIAFSREEATTYADPSDNQHGEDHSEHFTVRVERRLPIPDQCWEGGTCELCSRTISVRNTGLQLVLIELKLISKLNFYTVFPKI